MSAFFDAVGDFFGSLASIQWLRAADRAGRASAIYLTIRARAYFHVLRAAYPGRALRVPPHLGRLHRRLRLQQRRAGPRRRRHPAVPDQDVDPELELPGGRRRASSSRRSSTSAWRSRSWPSPSRQGAFPKPPDFSKLPAFDLAFFASHPRFTLFLLTVLGDRRRSSPSRCCRRACGRSGRACARAWRSCATAGATSARSSSSSSAAGLFRFTAFWFLLEAFNVGGSVAQRAARAGRQRGRRAACRSRPAAPASSRRCWSRSSPAPPPARRSPPTRSASRSRSPRARSRVGFGALVFIFRFRSFKEVIAAGREARGARRRPRRGLGEALARLAHQRHGLGEDRRHHGADLLRLLLGRALDVDRG